METFLGVTMAAGIFHRKEVSIKTVKKHMRETGRETH